MYPPVNITAGRFSRSMAISMPGTTLSQLPSRSMPSSWLPSTMDSTSMDTRSRLGRV